MPMSLERMRRISAVREGLLERVKSLAPRGGEIPVGGGEWIDAFFCSEALRGLLGGLRRGESLEASVRGGVAVGQEAIGIWNSRREWQVHRSVCWVEDYLQGVLRSTGSKQVG